jgi:oligopeptide transport system substrate-binding protein
VARRSWIGDYLDPNTFLSCWITGDGNNRTGWSSRRYDALLREAAREVDPPRRFAILREAEALLLDEGPTIPIYHYSTNELVKPYVHGIHQTALDVHPLTYVWIDRDWRRNEGEPPQALAEPRAAGAAAEHVGGPQPAGAARPPAAKSALPAPR